MWEYLLKYFLHDFLYVLIFVLPTNQRKKIMSNSQNITVAIKNQYGVRTVVPVCDRAKLFAIIAGTKTFSKPAIDSIRALGFEVEVQQVVETV